MEDLRRRIPFKLVGDDEIEDQDNVLDEQQQDALIEDLRNENSKVNETYYLALKVVIGLSAFLQLVTFSRNPLLAIYPLTSLEPSIPLPVVFVILSLFIHLNLAISFSEKIRISFQLSDPPGLSIQLLLLLSAVAPTLSLFLQKPWQTTIWWCITPLVVIIVQTVTAAIQENSQSITNLETMKYMAPGA